MPEHRGRVALVMNKFQGYEVSIPAAMRTAGFDAAWFDARISNGFFAKLLIRLGVVQRIRPLNDAHTDRLADRLAAYRPDRVLLISPETIHARDIARMRARLPQARIILYLWDSSQNRALDQATIDAVDAAYSFDTADCDHYTDLAHVPLFHFHEIGDIGPARTAPCDYDYCFVGTGRVRRIRVLSKVIARLKAQGATYRIYLFAPSLAQYILFKICAWRNRFGGTISMRKVPFADYLDMLNRSACVIDVEQENQKGLTIRTIDTVFAGRPLMTTNANVAAHDFYGHVPIGVFDPRDPDLSIPGQVRSEAWQDYFRKYSVSRWIETILTEQRPNYRKVESLHGPAFGERAIQRQSFHS